MIQLAFEGTHPRRAAFIRVAAVVAMVAATCAGLTATAKAAVITIGPSLAGSYESEDFENPSKTNATIANTSLPTAEGITSSPVDGAVISWSVIGAKGGPFKLRVVQANAGGTYTAVGTSAPGVPAGPGLQTFASAVPIKAGQLIGLDNTNLSDEIGLKKVEGALYAFSLPALVEGVPTPMKPAPASTKRTVGFNAQILPAPVVSGTSAKHGSIKGGTKMTITGTDLSRTTAVSFGGVAAKSFVVASDTEISAVTPASKKIVSVAGLGHDAGGHRHRDAGLHLRRLQGAESPGQEAEAGEETGEEIGLQDRQGQTPR